MNIRNLFAGVLSVLGVAATINNTRADDCGPPPGAVIYSNAVGQNVQQYTIADARHEIISANAAVTNRQPANGVVLAGGAVATPIVGNGTFVPVMTTTSNYYSPWVYSNGVPYATGYTMWNQPTGYAPYYSGYPGVIGPGVNYGYSYPYISQPYQGSYYGGSGMRRGLFRRF